MAKNSVESNEASDLTLPISTDRDHILGLATARLTLLEYGDFECPHCFQAHALLQDVRTYFGDQLRLVFRHFPLTNAHPHAERASEAAEAAGAQNQFWAMHDMLFEHQEALKDQNLVDYAAAIELDLGRFERELAAKVHAARVREDFMSGVRSGVGGTPTFFINDLRYEGPWDSESLIEAIKPSSMGSPHQSRTNL